MGGQRSRLYRVSGLVDGFMTPERKAEVNRRLAEFEGYENVEGQEEGPPVQLRPKRVVKELPYYTTDLNALARLEGKLPPHGWEIYSDQVVDLIMESGHLYRVEGPEAEARAEAIYQYLQVKDGASPQP